MPLPHSENNFKSGGDADPSISVGPASNSITPTSPSDDRVCRELKACNSRVVTIHTNINSYQYTESPKLDGLDNLHSNLDAVAGDERGSNYPKITFRRPQTLTSVPLVHSNALGEPFSFQFEIPWSASSSKKRARRKSSNHSGSPIEPYSVSSSTSSTFIWTPESMLFSASPLPPSPLSFGSYDSSDSFKFKTPLTLADHDSGSRIASPIFPQKKVQQMTRGQ